MTFCPYCFLTLKTRRSSDFTATRSNCMSRPGSSPDKLVSIFLILSAKIIYRLLQVNIKISHVPTQNNQHIRSGYELVKDQSVHILQQTDCPQFIYIKNRVKMTRILQSLRSLGKWFYCFAVKNHQLFLTLFRKFARNSVIETRNHGQDISKQT